MRKALLIIVLFSVIGFFVPNPVFAYYSCGVGETSCQVGLGEDLVITARAEDEDGFPIAGVDVLFVWEITKPAPPLPANPTNLGRFTSDNSVSCSGAEITEGGIKCTEEITTGLSSVNLRGSSVVTIGGEVKVTATYAGGSRTKLFTVSSLCLRDPILYYGIASVRDSEDNNWQSSTAEVLETCLPEYRLHDGMGWGTQ